LLAQSLLCLKLRISYHLNIRLLVYNSLVRPHIEYGIVTWGGVKNSKLQKIRSLQKKAIRAANNSTFKAHSNPLFSKQKVLNLDHTYKLCVLTFMHGYFNDNLPSSFQNLFKSLAEPNRTKSYKLERVLNKE